MRRTLVLFVRAPQLGTGKRRLARDIGDVAALRFERAMIALLLRRLAKDRRWRLRIAVTPDKARRRARHWRRGVEAVGQGQGDLGIRMRRALAPARPARWCSSAPTSRRSDARHVAALSASSGATTSSSALPRMAASGSSAPATRGDCRRFFERVRWSGPYALADTLAGLPRRIRVGYADRLEDVDDGDAYRRLKPSRGF